MRRFLLFIILVFGVLTFNSCGWLFSGNKHSDLRYPYDDSRVSDTLKSLYKEDAARLAVREQLKTDSERAVIDPDLRQKFYRALISVYNADAHGRNAIVDSNNIHTFPYPNLQQMIVGIDSGATWQKAWKEGKTLTGYEPVDDLITRYSLMLESYHEWQNTETRYAYLKSDSYWNMKAIADQFVKINDISSAQPDVPIGDGNNIRAQIGDHYIDLEYSLGLGDCPSGCTYRHYWMYRVDSEWNVTFTGEKVYDPLHSGPIDY